MMGVSIEVYRVRIGQFYDRSCGYKAKLQIDFLSVLFANLLILYGARAIPITLYIQISCTTALYFTSQCNIIQNTMPQMKTDKCLSCIIHNHAACIIVLLSIVIMLCTIVIDICFDIEKNPGPLLGNSASYESINSHFCLSHSGELTADFKSYLSLIHLNIQSLKPKCDIINAELSDF